MLTFPSLLGAIKHSASHGHDGRHYFDGRHQSRCRRKPKALQPGPLRNMEQDDDGLVRCFDARTGEYVWREIIRLPRK